MKDESKRAEMSSQFAANASGFSINPNQPLSGINLLSVSDRSSNPVITYTGGFATGTTGGSTFSKSGGTATVRLSAFQQTATSANLIYSSPLPFGFTPASTQTISGLQALNGGNSDYYDALVTVSTGGNFVLSRQSGNFGASGAIGLARGATFSYTLQ